MENILLLHGAIGDKEQMSSLANALKDKYKVHTIDFSGHGRSEHFCRAVALHSTCYWTVDVNLLAFMRHDF